MVDLTSPRWDHLRAAGGNPRLVPQLLRNLRDHPNDADWDEIWEQVSHQWTRYSSAYAALPHLVELGIAQDKFRDADYLLCLSRVAAPFESDPVPAGLEESFAAALRRAAPLAFQAAQEPSWERDGYICALQAAAALNGRPGPGTQLFFNLVASEPELACPECQAELSGEFSQTALFLCQCDAHMKPVSKRVKVQPRDLSLDTPQTPPRDDFAWLEWFCRKAAQDEVLQLIRNVYGTARCPICDTEFEVMAEVIRSHEP